MAIVACSCGGTRFAIHCKAMGTALAYHDENGVFDELDIDRSWFERSSVVRCEDCMKIRTDVKYVFGKVVELKDLTSRLERVRSG